jgi:hypothetical protein
VHGPNVTVGSSAGRRRGKEREADVLLHADDLAAVPLELQLGASLVQALPLHEKPSEEILEGFDGERLSPARGGCGLGRG